jgi:hypothetical protein
MNRMNIKARQVAFPEQVRGIFVAGLLLLATNFAGAQNVTQNQLTARYPSGSIQSTEIANQALADVDQQRAQLDRQYADQQHVCYTKFLATACLDAAKENHRQNLAQIHKIEVEANSFIRGARVVERDKRLAEKRAKDANNPPKPVADTATQAAQPSPPTPHDAKPKQAPKAEQLDAQQRADNVAAFEKKAQDAAARQRDVADKKAEKERQAAAKASAAAASASAAAVKP